MSDDIYHNVLNTEIQGTDRMEMMVDIYESGDDLRTQTNSNTNKQQPLQSTGSERVRIRCNRSVTVCLVLLCVLLLTAVIVLCVLINTNNQQCQNKNFTEERNQLLTKYTSITEEKDKLIAKYNNITKLSEQWNQTINGLLTGLYDGWINFKSSLYFISSQKKNWTDSRRDCIERGADLIIINNKKEQDLFKNRSETDSIWIGLSDSDEEDRWKWVDGSTLTTSFWDKVLHKEPNGKRGENCVGSYSPGWADFPCTRTFKWICEKTLY